MKICKDCKYYHHLQLDWDYGICEVPSNDRYLPITLPNHVCHLTDPKFTWGCLNNNDLKEEDNV